MGWRMVVLALAACGDPGEVTTLAGPIAQVGSADFDRTLPFVAEVGQGSPAQAAGIRSGEVIEGVEGDPGGFDAVVRAVRATTPGDPVALRVRRDGAVVIVRVTTEAAPDGTPVVGVRVVETVPE